MSLRGYDIDGVLTSNVELELPCVVISGRTSAEYDDTVKALASRCPVYIRGVGEYGDAGHAGEFKAAMINLLGVTEFWEDDPTQARIIRLNCDDVVVYMV